LSGRAVSAAFDARAAVPLAGRIIRGHRPRSPAQSVKR
jgi:hypothetical protein